MPRPESPTRDGLLFGLSAYVIWGLFPLYLPLLEPAGTIEILASRTGWSFVLVLVLLRLGRGFDGVRRAIADRRQLGILACAALCITFNWGTFIYGVNTGHVVETSLGYFINPLITITLGVAVLRERLRPAQWAAVAIGATAVVVIGVGYGHPPWIALVLGLSFGMYGFFKKKTNVGAIESLTVETGILFVPALAAIAVIAVQGQLVFGTRVDTSLLLASSGAMTAGPLVLFAAGTRRLPLSVVGLLQYVTPVLQFSIGVVVRHEHLPASEWAGFALVWVALIVLSVDGLRAQRRSARPADAEVPAGAGVPRDASRLAP